ncbi:MAG TPA: sporulation protein YqfD [Bacillota bacterium]|nr:sporulation protein YqfD [Bacillota bacterium]
MRTNRLLAYIFGSAVFAIPAKYAKIFINEIIKRGLNCSDNGVHEDEFFLRCSVFSVRYIIRFAQERNIPLRTVNLTGIPFAADSLRKRYGLLAGALIGFIIILLSGFFVWDVEIKGSPETKELINKINISGVKAGMYIPNLDILDSEIRFLLENNEYSFAAFNVRGTIVYVELRTRNAAEEEQTSAYSNLIATDSGIIVSVEAFSGFPMVEKGDFVIEGELLVIGAYERKNGTTGLVRSSGRVMAECVRQIDISVPLITEIAYLSGRTYDITEYSFFGTSIICPFSVEKAPDYEYCEMTYSYTECNLFGLLSLPLKKAVTEYHECVVKTQFITYQTARQRAVEAFEDECKALCGKGTEVGSNYEIVYNQKTNSAELSGELVYIKDIAKEIPFEVS